VKRILAILLSQPNRAPASQIGQRPAASIDGVGGWAYLGDATLPCDGRAGAARLVVGRDSVRQSAAWPNEVSNISRGRSEAVRGSIRRSSANSSALGEDALSHVA
jgi:hypothetical protein